MGIFEKFKLGFKKSAENITSGLREIIIKKEIDDKTLDGIEELLIKSDVGVEASSDIRKIISEKKIEDLVISIQVVLKDAINAGGSSLKDHVQTTGEMGYFQHQFRVYSREGKECIKKYCTGKIRRIIQSGRSTFFCNQCQR